jgi:FRG domain
LGATVAVLAALSLVAAGAAVNMMSLQGVNVVHDVQQLEGSLDNHTFALSLAQHYGLPSMGLDLTDQIDTALFFALHQFKRTKGRGRRVARSSTRQSVMYLFVLPERFCIEHARARPRVFPKGRPDTQRAWFSHIGWGYRRNQCAEYLVRALYLDEGGDFGPLPRAEELFPNRQNDRFGSLMEIALAQDWASSRLSQFLKQLY